MLAASLKVTPCENFYVHLNPWIPADISSCYDVSTRGRSTKQDLDTHPAWIAERRQGELGGSH